MTQFESRQSEKVTETATEARQGSYGRPVLMVLVCSPFSARPGAACVGWRRNVG